MSGLQRTKTTVTATWTFFEGDWHEGDVRIMGPRTHACWLGSMVVDGARPFQGVGPCPDLHFSRVNASAPKLHLEPVVPTQTWIELARDGIKRFGPGAELYVRPMYWAESGPLGGIPPDPDS